LQLDLNLGMSGSKAVQQVDQNAVAGGDGTPQADLALKLLGRVGQLETDLIPLLRLIVGVSLELEPLDSELHGAVVAVEQRYVEFDLELSYVARQCGRADVGASAGPAKNSGFH
jgi:hypothetical protein